MPHMTRAALSVAMAFAALHGCFAGAQAHATFDAPPKFLNRVRRAMSGGK